MCACIEILSASLSSSSPVLPYGAGPEKQSGISFELRVRREIRRVKKLPKLEDDSCSNNEISVCVCVYVCDLGICLTERGSPLRGP